MPELPEVETIVRQLKVKVLKRTFLNIWTDSPKMIKRASLKKFQETVKNKKIQDVYRVGKNIVFKLSEGISLLFHLKLTGHFLYGKWEEKDGRWQPTSNGPIAEDPMNRFLHLIFWLDNGYQLALSDLRKFAKVELWETKDLTNIRRLKGIGPDALEISLADFKSRIKKKKTTIKQALMDQKIISGIGNIYANEILFEAMVHPARQVPKVKDDELEKIYKAMRLILRKALKLKGSSVSDYREINGEKGKFDKILKVYGRAGLKCFRCGHIIKKITIGGRSAYFCPYCQK